MNNSEIISKTELFVKDKLSSDASGHDWWHIVRVRNLALKIASKEEGNAFIIELAALLHDVADWKFNNGDELIGGRVAEKWLKDCKVNEGIISEVVHIVNHISYKGANTPIGLLSLEGNIVQDADRLDAIGAIGIARTFAYGASKNRPMYEPDIKPSIHNSFEEYKKSVNPTINHFYEKLLLLKDRMNTQTAKEIAESRHLFMEKYLEQFYKEWNSDDFNH